MAVNTDTIEGGTVPEGTGIAESSLVAARNLQKQRLAALNLVPGAKLSLGDKYAYLTAPRVLPRLFGLPLPAPGHDPFKRRVSQGWGAPRYIRNPDGTVPATGNRKHMGLDFPADVGTEVYAAYSGVVTFTGVQTTTSKKRVTLPYADGFDTRVSPSLPVLGGGNVLDKGGQLSVKVDDIGDGGIAVLVAHGGDFAGYVSQYYHLSKVVVAEGAAVVEGQLLGYVGVTGGRNGWFKGPHLHWQVSFQGVLVKPEGLVPSTVFSEQGTGYTAAAVQFYKEGVPTGQATVIDSATNISKTTDRSTNAANQTRADLLERSANHYNFMANVFVNAAGQVYESVASFLDNTTKVSDPMVFDFETGLWSDGEPT